MPVDSAAFAVAVRVVMVLGLKRMIPKPLLKADAQWSGAHEGPRSL